MGAWDNPLAGQSTYYVELQQTSQILSNVTSKSLVILDELGRGTSTIDGCSLAYATLKHLLLNVKCCTLFVTHYWLLTSLEAEYPENVANFYMGFIEEQEDNIENQDSSTKIVFLYTVEKGVCPAQRSYAMNVARLAGIPTSVIVDASKR